MKFDSKKVFKFAGEISGCVVMGIVSAATQTLWYRIAEPKILNAMDKNEAKRKQPIGFRGVLSGSSKITLLGLRTVVARRMTGMDLRLRPFRGAACGRVTRRKLFRLC